MTKALILSDDYTDNASATIEIEPSGDNVAICLSWDQGEREYVQAIFTRADAVKVAHAILGITLGD